MPIDISASHYATGTATVAGTVVTGQGTTWLGAVRPGDLFGTHKGSGVRIASVNSNTSIALAYAVTGLNQTAAVYEIQRTPYDVGYLAAIEDMIRLYGVGNLPSLAGLNGTGGDKGVLLTGAGTAATFALTATARDLMSQGSYSAMRAAMGVQAAGSYQPASPTLSAIAAASAVFPSSLGLNLSGSMEFIALATSAQAKAGTNTLNTMTPFTTAEAIRQLVVRTQIFATSGTYTPHANMLFVTIECVGGAGAGGSVGGVADTNMASAGGGGGSYARRTLPRASLGASQPVTVGVGGSPGAAGNNPGGAGGTSSLGTLCSAGGGNGGGGALNPSNISGPGTGGTATVGDLTLRGSDGGGGAGIFQSAGQALYSGYGGASILSGTSVVASGAAAGTAGKNFGGGGSGATSVNTTNRQGGAGSQGIVIITEFCWA